MHWNQRGCLVSQVCSGTQRIARHLDRVKKECTREEGFVLQNDEEQKRRQGCEGFRSYEARGSFMGFNMGSDVWALSLYWVFKGYIRGTFKGPY